MRFKAVNSPISGIDNVVLFAETKKDDYTLNHLLMLASDIDDADEVILARKHENVPENTIATSRNCITIITS